MSDWQKVIAHLAHNVEEHFDSLKYNLADRLGHHDPVMIQSFRGFGTERKLYLKGRVLENKGITAPEENDSLWENLVNMYRRFESDEIPGARLLARFGDIEQEVVSDEEGYFEVWIEPQGPLDFSQPWQTVALELLEPADRTPARALGQVFVPPPGCSYGVISDIDDTVLQTDAAHLLRMARTVFLGNARTRLPFEGAAAFYRALLHGPDGKRLNPLFYVSSSPWNLYDLLSDFFNLQDIPFGPVLMLRDWGLTEEEILPIEHRQHKMNAIEKVMELYEDLPFILVGDSGQEDPEIYSQAVEQYPGRILGIYIRNVSRDLKRPEAIRELAKKVAEAGSSLILADNTLPMAQHAASQGWIVPQALPVVKADKEADEAPPTPVEKMLGVEEKEKKAEAPTVVVETAKPEQARQAVDAGAIEEALKTDAGENKKAPTVIVTTEESKK